MLWRITPWPRRCTGNDQEREAVEEYRKACALDTHHAAWFAHLAVSLGLTGDLDGAVANFRKSLTLDPSDAGTETGLGTALFENGQAQEGYEHLRKAIDMAPDFPDAHNQLGWELAKTGRMDEAVDQLQKAITLRPTSVEFRFNLGYVMGIRGDSAGAVAAFQKAVELSAGKDWQCLAALADAYNKSGRSEEFPGFFVLPQRSTGNACPSSRFGDNVPGVFTPVLAKHSRQSGRRCEAT